MASVKVAVRVRPLNKREKDMASAFIVHMEAQKTFITNVKVNNIIHSPKLPLGMEVSHTLGRERVKQFCYDYSYWSADKHDENYASQQRVYEDLGDDVVKSAYEGYNACVFAYGQTGSGKTYTMMGEDEDEGIIPRICQSLFSKMQDGDTTYRTEVSYLEIYNERVRDLLREKPKDGKQPNLRVREHPKDGPYVQDLSKHIVVNYLEIEELMEKGNINRTTAATNMNDVSSRSHAIFTIVFTQAKFQDDIPSEIHSKIHLVDLAGSERVDASGATGQRLKEGGSINKSLVTLGKIISTLADVTDKIPSAKKNVFIPYRDSVLTWLLKDSLGGNAKTIMIATISPADCNYAETLSTLRYASRAKRIINKPTVNEDPNVKLIRELREENARLRALLSGQNIPNFQQNVAAQEKLERNEEKVKQLTEKWTGKWQETAAILQEHKTLALRKEGIGVVLDSELPYLLALDDDILSTGMKLYHLKEGETTVGREDATVPQDIALSGQYIEAEHCIFQNFNCSVILVPLGGALCCVNNSRIHETTKISQGAIIRLGRHHLFRFNHPWEAARLREELRSGQIAMLKVSHDFQWTWSSPSIPDSALGSELEIEQKPPEELEKLEEKRRQLEALEEEHLFAEATRLATLVEQEGIKEDLLEKEEELHILKFETDIVKSEAEKVQKEIKRLSSHFEEQVQEHLQESHKLIAEQERVASEKARVEEEKRSAQEERAKLTEERKKESTWMSVEKERQLEEWAELNQEKRRLAIAKEREEKQRVTKSEVEAAREVEKEIYSQAMVEMRTLIQEEVKQLKRLSGLDNITPTELSSSQSATTLQTNSQSGTVIENTMNGHADLHQSDEIELQIKELQLNLAQSEGRDEVNMSQSESSEVSSLNHSDYRDRTAQSVHSDLSEREEFRGDGSRGSVSHDLSLLDHSESAIDRIVSYLMEEHAQAMARSGDESMMGSMCESIHSTEDGPVLPTKYLTGSPMAQRPTELLLTCGLDDSIISQSSEASVPPSMDDVAAMLAQLDGHVSGIHSKVCESLRRKYTSMLSSDDTTQGLGNEVIHQFTQIRPLFDELEKVAHQFPLPADVKDLPERLEHFDRTLTTVDQFLRIHEAVQAIVGGIKTKRFLEIVENLEIVQKLMADVDVCGDLESSVYRVLQTEVCIQREQLLFQLGETWNELLKWTLPNDSRRNANQPRTATLEIPEEEESKGILEQCAQAMLKVNMLQARIKTLCDRLMTYFVEATVLDSNSLVQMVIDTRKSVLCVVQYPKSQQGTQVVPAAQLFPKLEQVFIFLHRRFVDVLIEENIDIKGQKVKAIKDHKPEKQTVPLIRKIGHLMTRQLFEYIFNECLCHSIPKDNSKWDKFNEVVTLTEKFQDLLVALNFVPKDQSNLLDYFNNVNSLFANMKGQEILKRAHQMMTHDLQVSVEVSTEHPLGEPEADKPPATVMSPTLQLFVKTCREEVGASSQRIPTCQISISVQGLVCLTYDTVREALMGSAECATHLSYTVHNVFELFCDVLPSYHKDKLTTLPLLAALHHNNCMFVAHHVMTMDKKLRIKICPDPTTPTKYAMLCDLVPKVRKLGNDNFTHHIVMKKQELCSCLMPADGFECIADDEGRMASEALAEVARRLHDISSTWRQVLPIKVYCKAMGTLLNAVVMDIVDSVLLIGEFSADDCEVLQSTLSAMTSSSVGLFTLQQTRSNPLVLLHEYVPNWMKFNELLLILGSRLQDVSDRWADGKGPLALHFSAQEVRKLVIAMFENTSKRDALLAQLR